MGENDWVLITLGVTSGGLVTIIISLIIFVISSRSRKNKEKQKELIGKAVAHMMGKVNELFIAYRLGDLAFDQMERETREYISKITDDINENNTQLSSAYVAVVTRYIEEKTEMLIAIKEDFHLYNAQQQNMQGVPQQPVANTQVAPHPVEAEQRIVDPVIAMEEPVAPIPEPAMPAIEPAAPVAEPVMPAPTLEQAAPVAEAAPENDIPDFQFDVAAQPEVEEAATPMFEETLAQPEIAPVNEMPVIEESVAPAVEDAMPTIDETPAAPVADTFDFSTITDTPEVASAPQDAELSAPIGGSKVEPEAGGADDIFDISFGDEAPAADPLEKNDNMGVVDPIGDTLDFSSTQEFAKSDISAAANPMSEFSIEEPQAPSQPAQPAASADNGLSIETDEFTSAIDNAFDLTGFGTEAQAPSQPAQPVQPMASTQPVQPAQPAQPAMESNPFQGFEAPSASGFSSPSEPANSKFSLNGSGDLDVEATQEFNLNDIMSQAQEMDTNQGKDEGMVSGDDVASKLDSFFS